MRTTLLMIGIALVAACAAPAEEASQTDWSGGGGVTGPVIDWGSTFHAADDLSWLSVPGQLALSSNALPAPVECLIDADYYGSFGIHSADIDNDGDTDIVGAADASGVVLLWLNNGDDPVSWTEQIIDGNLGGASAVFAADVDCDHRIDVVGTAATPQHTLVWWRNNGGDPIQWTRFTIKESWPNAFEVFCADMDHDGDPDVLSAACTIHDVAWWRNDGGDPVQWTEQTVTTDFDGAHSAVFADLDGDGDSEIVAAAANADEIAWWRNDGGDPIRWTKHVVRQNFIGVRSVCTPDIDSDGSPDIAGTSWTDDVAWWRNDGGDPIQWTEQLIDGNFPGGHSIYAADVNGDGNTDILAAGVLNNQIAWWENSGGDPIHWTKRIVETGYTNAITVRADDVDGDGDIDPLGVSYYWGEFTWWEAVGFQPAGELEGSILDTQRDPETATLTWSARQPLGTSLAFRVRSSNDPESMGVWSEEIIASGHVIDPVDRYIQYKVILESTDPSVSPILQEMVVDHMQDPSGFGDESCTETDFGLWTMNPAHGAAAITVTVPEACRTRIRVIDLTGRVLTSVADRVFCTGRHRLEIDRLPAGVYFCQMHAGAFSTCRRFIVVR